MTDLTKPLRRATQLAIRSGPPQPIIIALYPEGTIGFRLKGRRKEYLLDLTSAYLLAAQKEAERLLQEERRARRKRTK